MTKTAREPGSKPEGGTAPSDSSRETVSENVIRHGNEYRWLHDVSLWRDTVIPLMLFRLILLAALIPALLLLVIETLEGSFLRGLQAFGQVYLIVASIMLGLFIIAYPLYVLVSGGRYSILFEMDDKGIDHIEMPSRGVKRTDLLARVGFLAGLASGNPSASGASLLALSRKRMHTPFNRVRKVVVYERKGVVKLIARNMTRNLIYAQPADFKLIKDLLLERCPRKATVIYR
ncbi:hypothetical protein [Thioalkalivibrio sp. ALJT]|uniref:hypothetical protein n=1 Tax=Thioalkalivibrio sp. ALJT TaxID=1158146 RepID=UPI0012DFB6F2|nr:hypothetical protein [Thioalkalivibrio sp. ALJT]